MRWSAVATSARSRRPRRTGPRRRGGDADARRAVHDDGNARFLVIARRAQGRDRAGPGGAVRAGSGGGADAGDSSGAAGGAGSFEALRWI